MDTKVKREERAIKRAPKARTMQTKAGRVARARRTPKEKIMVVKMDTKARREANAIKRAPKARR